MMPPIRRINLYGGPCSGKSTTASTIFAKLKNRFIEDKINIHVELVQEYIKNWAYENRAPSGFDQVYVFAQQMHREDILLRNGVELIISDSPLLMNYAYGAKQERPGYKGLLQVVNEFEAQYPSIDIFLERGDRPYVAKGRYQTAEQAKEMDDFILNTLKHYGKFHSISYDNVDKIIGTIFYELGALEQ